MSAASRFDVVVAGAGPAGSSAAAVLAGAGLRVALVDKARFPRDKLCGGLLSQRGTGAAARVFGAGCVLPIEATSAGVSVYLKDQPLVRARDCKAVHFTSRRRLDAQLASLAAACGATLIEGVGVAAIDPARAAVTLADRRVLSAPFVIGADGAASRVRKQLEIPIDRRGFAVGLEAEVPRSAVLRDVLDPEIYFDVVEWGYGWVFPKRDTLTVGIGGLAAANADMRARFRDFASIAIGRMPDQPVCGSPIPFGNFIAHPGRGSVLLVGDAAGLVEPVTGEGIAFAIQSGFHAARAIIDAACRRSPARALEFYAPGYRSIVRSFRDASLLRRLVFSKSTRRLFFRALTLNPNLVTRHMDVLAGDVEYRDYARLVLRKTFAHLPRVALTRVGRHRAAQ